MKVAFVCQWYPPEPAAVPESIARSLEEVGCHVQVLTGVPNYPTGVVAEGFSAIRASREVRDGLRVRRTPLYPSHDASAVKRMANYLSWALSASVFGQREVRRADAVLVYSSPATAALPAMVGKALWGTPYVLLVQDVWPDSVFASGFLPGPVGTVVRSLLTWFVNRTYAMADHVAVISPGMMTLLAERGVPAEKLSVVHNWVPEEQSSPHAAPDDFVGLRERVGADAAETLFLYAGNHGRAQGLETVVDAFVDGSIAGAHLVLLGSGVTKPDLQKRAEGSAAVTFLDPVGRDEAARLLSQSDVSVVSLADEPLFAVTMPSKVQSGLATCTPLLVVARGDAAEVVTSARAGAAAAPGDVAAVREAVAELVAAGAPGRRAMGERGREVYSSDMARAVGAGRLSDLLERAAARRRRGRIRTTSGNLPERKTQ